MDKDTFVSTKNNIPKNQPDNVDDNNFFTQTDKDSLFNIMPSEPSRRLNDYDYNILKEGAYRDVDDEIFKLEYKIAKTEEEIKELEEQILSANEIYDYYLADNLTARKTKLEDELRTLTQIYKEASISAKISGGFASKIKKDLSPIRKTVNALTDFVISKLPGKFSSILSVRQSLKKLENINRSVDDLMKYQYPYGEAGEKYEQLSKYIAKANSIQSEIYKFMK